MYFVYKFELANGFNYYSYGTDKHRFSHNFTSLRKNYPDFVVKGVEVRECVETREEARKLKQEMTKADPNSYQKFI